MKFLIKAGKRITPILLSCFYLFYYTAMLFTASVDRHGFLFIGGLFGVFLITILLVADYAMWKLWRWKWYWLWLTQLIIIAIMVFIIRMPGISFFEGW